MKKLTIGSAVYDDFDGVYFSYQSLRLNNLDIKDDLDFVIIDNNPDSPEGKATKHFCKASQCIRYVPFTEKRSTAVRNEIFNNAEGEFCMSIDCHVLFEPNTIKRLIDFFEKNPESDDLYHGPMLYDMLEGHVPVTHMNPQWRDNMLGTWGCATKGKGTSPDDDPFEIPMHGLGIFASRTKSWMGFNDDFIGFGGEEGYIHEKYKKDNRKIWCLPFLRWIHRFDRPRGVQYPLVIEERVRNYLIGRKELDLPYDDIIEHFKKTQPHLNVKSMMENLDSPIKNVDPPKKDGPKKDGPKKDFKMPQKMTSWRDSNIDFVSPYAFRYLKIKVLDSYDGYGALEKVCLLPDGVSEDSSIYSVTSEDENHPAKNILNESAEGWQTESSSIGEFPHEIIIDFVHSNPVKKIILVARMGWQKGMPTKFSCEVSQDLQNWNEISNEDILKNPS